MGTEKSVGDEKRKLTAEEIGGLQKKTNEIVKRIENRSIFFEDAINGMQDIIEGKSRRLRFDSIPPKKWWEENGVIYIRLVSDGTTGRDWIIRLEKQGLKVSNWAKQLLLSKDFKPTIGTVYIIAVFRESPAEKVRSKAGKRKIVPPNPEITCLIHEMFSDDEIKSMGLTCIVTFHEPIKDYYGDLGLLCIRCNSNGSLLDVNYNNPYDCNRNKGVGFAFEVS